MLSKFPKIFFFTSLVVAIVIAVFATLNSTSDLFISLLVETIYSPSGEISTGVVAFFPIAATILSGLLALVASICMYFICKKQVAASPKKTKFFLYYFISLVVISLLVLLFCTLRLSIFERYIWERDVIIIPILYGVCVVEALVVAAFLVSFFTLWKTNKLAASIIGVIIILLIPANFISGYAVYEASSYSSVYDSYYGYPAEPSSNMAIEDDADGNTFEDYPDDIEDDYLSFLWGEGEYGVGGAANVLFSYDISAWNSNYPQSFLFDVNWTLTKLKEYGAEEITGNIPDEAEKRASLIKIYDYLIANPSEAVDALGSYRNVLYYYMPIEQFYGTAAYQALDYLSAAHEDLYNDGDLSRLRNIYKLMSNIEHDFAYEYYNDIKLHINDSYLSRFNDIDGDFYQGGLVWAYSFWARRNAEGTDNIAYTMLNMLQDYYSEAEYYQNYGDEEEEDYSEEEEDYDEE